MATPNGLNPTFYTVNTTNGYYVNDVCIIDSTGAIIAPISLALGDDDILTAGTTTTTAATKVTIEFDKTTTGIGQIKMGDESNAQVLGANATGTVQGFSINLLHNDTTGEGVENFEGFKSRVSMSGDGDAGVTMIGGTFRSYVLAGVAGEVYGIQPWAKHMGTGTITAMSGLSAKCDVTTDAFSATTVNAGHFHIDGAATVTSSMFDGVMIEVYPDVTCLDSGLRIVADTGAVVSTGIVLGGAMTNGITLTGTYTNGIDLTGATLTGGIDNALFSIGSYSGAKAFTTTEEVLPFQVVITSGTDGGSSGDSLMAGYFKSTNTGAFTNRRIQGVMGTAVVAFNVFDAYGVQGHVSVTDDISSTAGTGNICGMSAKATVASGKTATGTVSGLLVTVDGAGAVTGTHSGVWIDNVAASDQAILISGSNKLGINMNGISISAGAATDDAGIKTAQGATAPAGSIYISTNGTVFVMVSTTWTALTIN